MFRLFAYLRYSRRDAHDPFDFILACENDEKNWFPLDSDVTHQNDANEFYSLLVDRFGIAFPREYQGKLPEESGEGEGSEQEGERVDMMTALMSGSYAQQIIGKTPCTHTSEREEAFLALSLDVSGKTDIQQSLSTFVTGELLSGDNAYYCGVCDDKVRLKAWHYFTASITVIPVIIFSS